MIEVLKEALNALEISASAVDGYYIPVGKNMIPEVEEAIKSLRQAIAELESQQPVATVTSETGADITMSWWHEPALPMGTKLFTHPPQRTWVGLTRTQIQDVYFEVLKEHRGGHQIQGQIAFGEALQAKIKEKNT
jgi:hypothetical protein